MELNAGISYELTIEHLQKFLPAGNPDTVAAFFPKLQSAMVKYEINTTRRAAAFFAQICHESSQLNRLEENLNYSADRLLAVFPKYFTAASAKEYARNPEKIANRVYANKGGNGGEETGDGWKYRGRGPFQYTLKDNYHFATAELKYNFIADPDAMLKPGPGAFSAALYWERHGLNRLADIDAFEKLTKKINTAGLGMADRLNHWQRIRGILKVEI